jgi:hypothetical protein
MRKPQTRAASLVGELLIQNNLCRSAQKCIQAWSFLSALDSRHCHTTWSADVLFDLSITL